MQRIETDNPNLLSYREPAYWSWIVSVPFYLAASIFVLKMGGMFLGGVSASMNGLGMLIVFGVGLFLVYLALSTAWDWFGRRGCLVDREENTITAEAGLFVLPMVCRTVSLREYNQFYIHGWREVGTRTGTVYRTEYYIDLFGKGSDYVRLGRADNKADLLDMADAIGEFADLDVVDGTFDPPNVRRRGGKALLDAVSRIRSKWSATREQETASSE